MLLNRRPDLERFLAAPGAARAAVVHGRDHGVVRERADALARAATDRPDDPFDVALLTDADVVSEEGRLEGELMAVSMLGGRRLVRLRLSGESVAAERIAGEALARHLAGELNPDAFLLVEAGQLRNDSALVRGGKDSPLCGVIPCYEDEPGELARMARAALTQEGLALSADALEVFVGRLPHDRGVARQEIERLTLFLGPGRPGQASLADLTPFFGVEPEASLGEAAMHAFGGRLAAAQTQLRLAQQEGEGGVAAIRAMSLHLGRLRKVGTARAGGASPQAAVKAAGIFWKNEREVLRQANAWSLPTLAGPQADILAAEIACKRAGSPDRLLAERLAFSIAHQARRLGL
ncbi:MAG TPA: DNA polymerase III subunit delta [Caulobacteraceae bacterium]